MCVVKSNDNMVRSGVVTINIIPQSEWVTAYVNGEPSTMGNKGIMRELMLRKTFSEERTRKLIQDAKRVVVYFGSVAPIKPMLARCNYIAHSDTGELVGVELMRKRSLLTSIALPDRNYKERLLLKALASGCDGVVFSE